LREIVLDYKPREAFREYHQSTKRFCVTVAHRRAGKTVARVNKLIRAAVAHQRINPAGRFGYLAPFRNQAKKIAWEYLKHFAAPLVQMGGKVNESDLIITMPHNHATIELYGADNAEAMRGLYFDGIVPDEAQGISRSTLSQIILPCLSDFRGWLDCAGTPRGWSNLLGELVKMARKDTETWHLQILRASETGIIPPEELAQQRAIMSENEYEQEFECNFDAAITGAVYGAQIALAERAGRLVAALEPLAGVPVHTSWDLGYDDATAIWWWQSLPGELRILDYYENANQDIEHYCDVIKARPYIYGKHHVPHDAMNELLAAGGRSIVQQAFALGVKMQAWPATSQQNAIEAARKTLERCWFDRDKCELGLEALRQYQFEFDADKKVYRSKPRHDWASHAADAFELIAQVWKQPVPVPEPAKPRFLHEIESRELFDLEGKFRKSSGSGRI
jgi:hypothetical protein